MTRKTVVSVSIILLIALTLFSGNLLAVDKKKKKVSPAVTAYEMYVDYYQFKAGQYLSAPASVIQNTSTGNLHFTADINLPSNATITGLTMRAVMGHNYSSDTDRLVTYLYRRNDYGGLVVVKQVKANYAAGNSSYRTKSTTFSVPVANAAYVLVVKVPGSDLVADISYMVSWVKISYTTP